ncbi:MAG TPA: hemolysin III family protein [Alcanivoracaceae bacterium]|nr:hemolysin III family protein [Alcanivoracaceae bacterium]
MSTGYSRREESINSLTHGIGAVLSIIGTFLLLIPAIQQQDIWKMVSFSVFGVSLALLYTASTLYHGARKPETRVFFKLLDHCAIFILIAGTYTPFLLVNLRGTIGWLFFSIVWGLAITGVLIKLIYRHRLKAVRLVIYLTMGWLILFASNELLSNIDQLGFTLLLAGGIIYTAGVFFYLADFVPYNHAIWHLFVVGGSACHFLAIYYSVLPH